MDHRAATQQARSGLVVRESKLFQDGGGVSVVCSRKKCCRVSFLVAALVQGVLVICLQVAIVVLGLRQFEDSPVEEELTLNCACESEVLNLLDLSLNVSAVVERSQSCTSLNSSLSSSRTEAESLGKDKLAYAILFIVFVLYNFGSLSLAVYTKSIIDVYFSLLLNALLVIYSFVQVYQFRSFTGEGLEVVGYVALTNALVLLVSIFVFGAFTGEMHTEFGWWTFTWFKSPAARLEGGSSISLQLEGEGSAEGAESAEGARKKKHGMKAHSSHLRFYYRYYRITIGVSWLVLLFHLTFFVGELALFLPVECDFEGPLTILLIFALPLILLLGYIAVRNEYRLLTLGIVVCLCLSIAFFLFKLVRFATRQCPRCRLRQFISELLHTSAGGDRNQQLEHLVLFSTLNLIGLIVLLIMVAIVTLNYNKGLGDHFRQRWKAKKGWRKHLDLSFSIPAALKWMCCRWHGTRRNRDINANE